MPLQIPDQNIAMQGVVPDQMRPISQFLNIGQQAQTLKSSQLDYKIADTANQKRIQLRDLAASPEMKDKSGAFDNTKYASMASAIDPEQGLRLGSNSLANQSQNIGNKTNEFGYQSNQASKGAQILSALANNPDVLKGTPEGDNAIFEAMQFARENGVDAAHINRIGAAIIKAPPEQRPPLFDHLQRATLSGVEQIGDTKPNVAMVSNGQQYVPVNTNARAPVGVGKMDGTPINVEAPVTMPVTNPDGTPGIYGQQHPDPGQPGQPGQQGPQAINTGGMTATPGGMQIPKNTQTAFDSDRLSILQQERANTTKPSEIASLDREIMRVKMTLPSTQQGTQQTQQPRGFIPTGMPIDTPELMQIRTGANQAAATVADSRSNNQQIRQILTDTKGDSLDPTGRFASNLRDLSSKMGFAVGTDAAANYNGISHNLALQQQTRDQQMGVKTDAGSKISAVSSGSPDQDRKTLTKAINISDAGNTGIEMFNHGMESSIKSRGISAIRDYKNSWSENYDVNALRLVNAGQSGDKQEAAEVIKLLGGVGSKAFISARQKVSNLEILSNGGQLNQGK